MIKGFLDNGFRIASGSRPVFFDDTNPSAPAPPPAALPNVTVNADTFHSIGIRVDLDAGDDPDYNATVAVEYKKSIDSTWKNALGLFRQDYAWYYGATDPYASRGPAIQHFAGSIMFLTPGTSYDVRLTYSDPQSSDPQDNSVYQTTVSTRAIPVKPTGGTTYYVDGDVAPGGDGSTGDPWASIAEAQSSLSAGDIVRVRAAVSPYAASDRTAGMITTAGTEDNWIVYEEDPGSPGAVFSQLSLEHGAEWIWIDGLTFTYAGGQTVPATRQGLNFWDEAAIYVAPPRPSASVDNICVTDCSFDDFRDSVLCPYACANWIVLDNDINGMWAAGDWNTATNNSSSGYGVGLPIEDEDGGSGHIVGYNTITQCSKPVAVGGNDETIKPNNCDVFGNKIYDNMGTSISFDSAYENMRAYGNWATKSYNFHISSQPQSSGPWYFLYNQFTQSDSFGWKTRVQDRIVEIGNTWQPGYQDEAQQYLRFYRRNNLYLNEAQFLMVATDRFPGDNNNYRESQWFLDSATNKKAGAPDAGDGWMGDSDYNGFDRGGTGNILARWNYDSGTLRTDFTGVNAIADLFAEVGIEEHSNDVDADSIFVSKVYDENTNLLLAAGANDAVEVGEKIPNLADWYDSADTKAPDWGCHNRTDGAPTYGQRSTVPELHLRTYDWTKH